MSNNKQAESVSILSLWGYLISQSVKVDSN